MRRRSAEPEDLPPLELRELRQLDLVEPSRPGRPAHLASASGCFRRGDFVYAVGDDELFLAVFELSSGEPGQLHRAMSGELAVDEGERSKEKPDLEALTALPPFEDAPHGALLGIGSGSGPGRDRGFFWPLGAEGSLEGEPTEIDLAPVYGLLGGEIAELNIEGASVVGDRLWLLQRGNSADTENAVAELSLEKVMRSMVTDHAIDPEELLDLRSYELGDLDGTELCFSDANALADGTLVFTASAEADDPAEGEDEIKGSVVGTIDREGEVHRLRTIDRKWKVEGVHATLDAGVIDLLFVCDQDDPVAPSPLLSGTIPAARG
ncbi:MAG TPA: hypothetical protein VGR10_06185 [Thermoleophilaceae bacterium]|nr:hypothetical protein [Thermoleophilaceae bacterium]